jgi:hypothetical protein
MITKSGRNPDDQMFAFCIEAKQGQLGIFNFNGNFFGRLGTPARAGQQHAQ